MAATLGSGFHLAQLLANHLVERNKPGKIVFISSVRAKLLFADNVAYAAAKAGLNQMACTIAAELAQHHINVNVIEPGWIETPGEYLTFGKEALQDAGKNLPWGRLGTPKDIGRAAVFLASDDADYITGVVLPVEGAFRTKNFLSGEMSSEE